MSIMYPECPLYNHSNSKDLYNPKLCALARKDRECLKKIHKNAKKKKPVSTLFKARRNVKETHKGQET
jgi:hypothetical protein